MNEKTYFGLSKKVIYTLLLFFFIIATFWTLKPMRTSGVIKAFGTTYYPLFKQGLLVFLPMILSGYFFLTCFFSRKKLIQFFTVLFLVMNIVFWGLYKFMPSNYLKVGFFFYIDAYITVMVTVFFTYLNQIFDTKEAGKVYGYIGSGGLLGGILGSSISGWAGVTLGDNIILAASLMLVPVLFLIQAIENQPSVKSLGAATLCSSDKNDSMMKIFGEGIQIVYKSKYMLAIAVSVGLYEIISTNVDYIFNFLSSQAFSSGVEMGAYQGKVFFIAQVVSLVIMLAITPMIHKKCGITTGLLFLPGVLLLGSVLFLPIPTIAIATFLIGGEAATSYSINQISKEILYIPLDNTSKVKGKAFIDMIVQRGAKAIGASFLLFFTLYLQTIGYTTNLLIGINIVLLLIWFYAIRHLSIEYSKLSACAIE